MSAGVPVTHGGVLKLGIDARPINRVRLRGMGRYLQEIIRRTSAQRRIEWRLFGDRPHEPLHLPDVGGLNGRVFSFRGSRFHSWEQVALPWSALRAGVQVLHCPMTGVPWWQPVPTVVTVHDTLPWTPEDPSERGIYRDRLLPAAYQKCAAIITISKSSQRDIIDRWPELEPKLVVIPHGISDRYLDTPERPLGDSVPVVGVRHPYLLYVGGALPRKRVDWAIRVLEGIARDDLRLVICGLGPTAREQTLQRTKSATRGRLCFAPFVAEEDLPQLYRHAVAVLYPTLYEGFGFPALEAQAVGTPVLFSALGSLAELRGPGAIVLPPEDLDAWLDACRTCLQLRGEHPRPNRASQVWARQFSWEVSARRHLEVYERAAATRRARRNPRHLVPAEQSANAAW